MVRCLNRQVFGTRRYGASQHFEKQFWGAYTSTDGRTATADGGWAAYTEVRFYSARLRQKALRRVPSDMSGFARSSRTHCGGQYFLPQRRHERRTNHQEG